MRRFQISLLGILFLALPTMGYHVAIFMPCTSSHIRPHLGVVRELIHRNHTITIVVHRDCHKYFKVFPESLVLVHNYGLLGKTDVLSNFVVSVHSLLSNNLILHQDVLKYFEENKIDVILSSQAVHSSCQMADKFNIPLLFNSYQIGIFNKEKCPKCRYTGTVTFPSPLSSLDPPLIVVLVNILALHIMTVSFHSLTKTIDSERTKLGLEEISPKSSMMYNSARFPMVYQIYHPLVPPSISLPDGRWLVGHISAEERYEAVLSDEYTSFLIDEKSVIFIAFGTIVQLKPEELLSIYRQISTQDVYKVIWSLKTRQQQQLSEMLEFSNLDEFQSKLPSQVKVVNFAPQMALLDSGSVRIFVSHGGYSSVLESVDSGVPLILHPVFADQFFNSNVMEEIGCGIVLNNLDHLNEDILSVMENYKSFEGCIENARETMGRAGGAPQVVDILERMSRQGYEGMSFEYLMDGVNDLYSSLFILLSTLALPIILFIVICYVCCCGTGKKKLLKKKKE